MSEASEKVELRVQHDKRPSVADDFLHVVTHPGDRRALQLTAICGGWPAIKREAQEQTQLGASARVLLAERNRITVATAAAEDRRSRRWTHMVAWVSATAALVDVLFKARWWTGEP